MREPVTGTVTLDGVPLDYGIINFRPQGHAAASSGSVVTKGKFKIPGDKGLQPGNYKVNIQAFKETGRMAQGLPGEPERPERVPVQINEAGQLTATISANQKEPLTLQLTTRKM